MQSWGSNGRHEVVVSPGGTAEIIKPMVGSEPSDAPPVQKANNNFVRPKPRMKSGAIFKCPSSAKSQQQLCASKTPDCIRGYFQMPLRGKSLPRLLRSPTLPLSRSTSPLPVRTTPQDHQEKRRASQRGDNSNREFLRGEDATGEGVGED